jgi:hypothetical protein
MRHKKHLPEIGILSRFDPPAKDKNGRARLTAAKAFLSTSSNPDELIDRKPSICPGGKTEKAIHVLPLSRMRSKKII